MYDKVVRYFGSWFTNLFFFLWESVKLFLSFLARTMKTAFKNKNVFVFYIFFIIVNKASCANLIEYCETKRYTPKKRSYPKKPRVFLSKLNIFLNRTRISFQSCYHNWPTIIIQSQKKYKTFISVHMWPRYSSSIANEHIILMKQLNV